MTIEGCRLIISHFEKKNLLGLTKSGFNRMISSTFNHVMNLNHRKIYQDMTKPLTHYFVASSHNTYLERDQFKGRSSVEMYAKVCISFLI
jgi:hypothetical protein